MSKLIDLTNQRFGRLTVIEKDKARKTNSGSYWICECDCGTRKSIKSSSLRRGEIQSCGCLHKEITRQMGKNNIIDLTGQIFGKLTVLQVIPKDTPTKWLCQCDCGRQVIVRGHDLVRKDENRTVSCGCYHRSIGATNILEILKKQNIKYIDEYVFTDLPHSRYDFAILDDNQQVIRLIEFDGEQHYKNVPSWGGLELQQKRDKIKNDYALSHNLSLVRIPYWEQDNITLDLIMSDRYLVRRPAQPVS